MLGNPKTERLLLLSIWSFESFFFSYFDCNKVSGSDSGV